MKVHKRKCVYALGSLDSHKDSPFLTELASYSSSTQWKKIHFYSVGTFLQFLMWLLKSKTSTSATHWVIPTHNHFSGEAKISRRAIIPTWLLCGELDVRHGSRRGKQEGVVWCDIQRYRQRFSQFHSTGVAELFTASVRKFFWKKSAKVKETKLTQTGQLVKTLLGSQSLDFLIPKSVTSEWIS